MYFMGLPMIIMTQISVSVLGRMWSKPAVFESAMGLSGKSIHGFRPHMQRLSQGRVGHARRWRNKSHGTGSK